MHHECHPFAKQHPSLVHAPEWYEEVVDVLWRCYSGGVRWRVGTGVVVMVPVQRKQA